MVSSLRRAATQFLVIPFNSPNRGLIHVLPSSHITRVTYWVLANVYVAFFFFFFKSISFRSKFLLIRAVSTFIQGEFYSSYVWGGIESSFMLFLFLFFMVEKRRRRQLFCYDSLRKKKLFFCWSYWFKDSTWILITNIRPKYKYVKV